jgi:hypothetical protein
MSEHVIKLVFDGLTGIGTMLLGALAIWGDKFRPEPRLKLELRTAGGYLTRTHWHKDATTEVWAMYVHLKLVNQRRWLAARECRVMLTDIATGGPDGFLHRNNLAVPLQVVWAPAEGPDKARRFRNVVKDQILDFFRITSRGLRIEPSLYETTKTLDEALHQPTRPVWFFLEIEAVNFTRAATQVFEVAWTGSWSKEISEMEKELHVREVEADEIRERLKTH